MNSTAIKAFLGLILAAMVGGCAEQRSAEPAPVQPVTPEARWANLIEAIERQIGDPRVQDATAVADFEAPPGTPITDSTIRLENKLTPPAGEGEPYRGTLRILTRSTVTMVLPGKPEAEKEAEEAAENSLGEEIDGIPPLEALVVPSVDTGELAKSTTFTTKPDERVSEYQFEYRDGRWELDGEIDEQSEPYNALVIKYALNRQ